jgi:hypothetical protein
MVADAAKLHFDKSDMQMRHDKNHPLSQTPKHKRTKLQERLFGKALGSQLIVC